jgi:Na+/proline symporter
VRFTAIPTIVLGAVIQSRMFSLLPHSFRQIDQSLLLISSVVLLQWNQIVDALAQYLTGQRSVSLFGTGTAVTRVALSAATVFAMSRRSALSPITGVYPFAPVVRLLFYLQLVVYARAFWVTKVSLNGLQREAPDKK